MSELYSDTLTDAESELGFQRVLVTNPNGGFYMNPNLVVAVVFRIGRGDRIIKLSSSQ